MAESTAQAGIDASRTFELSVASADAGAKVMASGRIGGQSEVMVAAIARASGWRGSLAECRSLESRDCGARQCGDNENVIDVLKR